MGARAGMGQRATPCSARGVQVQQAGGMFRLAGRQRAQQHSQRSAESGGPAHSPAGPHPNRPRSSASDTPSPRLPMNRVLHGGLSCMAGREAGDRQRAGRNQGLTGALPGTRAGLLLTRHARSSSNSHPVAVCRHASGTCLLPAPEAGSQLQLESPPPTPALWCAPWYS